MFVLIKTIIIKIQKETIKWVPSMLIEGQENVSFRLFFNLNELSRCVEQKYFRSQQTGKEEWMLPKKCVV